ncbi:MAG: hypothetical protein ABL907_09305 [Hyphomicrobium sp.]
MSGSGERDARARMQAEHRVVVQAAMQANRAGKLPGKRPASSGSEAITAVFVIVVVVAMLALVIRYAN